MEVAVQEVLEERKEEFKKSRKSELNCSRSAGGETGVVDYVMERRA